MCNFASPKPLANHSTIPVLKDAACAIDQTMNNDASIGDIHGLLCPPNMLHIKPTNVAARSIGTIVIRKLNKSRTNQLDSLLSTGNLVKL